MRLLKLKYLGGIAIVFLSITSDVIGQQLTGVENLTGRVFDAETKEGLVNAYVVLKCDKNSVEETRTNDNGEFAFFLKEVDRIADTVTVQIVIRNYSGLANAEILNKPSSIKYVGFSLFTTLPITICRIRETPSIMPNPGTHIVYRRKQRE